MNYSSYTVMLERSPMEWKRLVLPFDRAAELTGMLFAAGAGHLVTSELSDRCVYWCTSTGDWVVKEFLAKHLAEDVVLSNF